MFAVFFVEGLPARGSLAPSLHGECVHQTVLVPYLEDLSGCCIVRTVQVEGVDEDPARSVRFRLNFVGTRLAAWKRETQRGKYQTRKIPDQSFLPSG
jgi:hypothetical protein